MKSLWLLPAALILAAASPPRQITLTVPGDGFGSNPLGASRPAPTATRLEPAPLPDREVTGPAAGSGGASGPTVSPTVFANREQYRGDGFSRGSTAQAEQERNVRPSVGFKLRMPFTPN